MTDDGRVPPNDLVAEAAVLSAVFLASEALSEIVPILSVGDFYSDANRRIYEAYLALDEAGKPIDILTVRGWLADRDLLQRIGGPSYLAQILNEVPAVANVAEYATRIRTKARVRKLIATSQRIAAEGYGVTSDGAQGFIDSAEQAVFEIADDRIARGPQVVKDVVRDTFVNIQASLLREAERRATTGLCALDEILVGIDGGDVMILAARPGVGKTALAVNRIALTVAREGRAAAVFSLEMQRSKLVKRMCCSEARIDSKRLDRSARDERAMSKDDWSRLTVAAQEISRLPVYIDDESGLSMPALRAKTRRIAGMARRAGMELGAVIVDYLQLMGTDSRYRSREEGVAANSRGLKRLAMSLDVPVIALAQLNREVEKRGKKARPQMADLRESGGIEQDADAIVFLSQAEPQDDPYKPTIVLADIAKGRHRGTGMARVAFTKAFTRFDDLEPGYAPQERF